MQSPRVLFVSKPIAPPFHDGSICLVRDLARHLSRVQPIVLTTRDAPELGGNVVVERLYAQKGSYAPRLRDNARVLRHLLVGPKPSLWHFVFAPNPASSSAAHLAKAIRRVPCVQTIASVPRHFEKIERWLFGDRVVALSEHTKRRLVGAGVNPRRVHVIAPTVPASSSLTKESTERTRRHLELPSDRPLVVYPGDLEFSSGARLVAEAAEAILAATDAVIVYACRKKTKRADAIEADLRSKLREHGERVRFVGEVPSLPSLLSLATLVLFPVEDSYGKVDVPIAVLEAMALGIPVLALDRGPLAEVEGIAHLPLDSAELARAVVELLRSPARRSELSERALETVRAEHRPERAAARYEELYDELLGARRARP